jgi:hypothetical protein
VYTGIVTNDNLQTALQKIDQKFQDADLGYIFTNGIEQLVPGQPVMLGGALVKNTTIGGLYNLAFAGTLEASALITTGGASTDFVKGDGSLDPTSYQPAGNYITNLTGDVTANGPGSVAATLATVFGAPGTYGTSGFVPRITVDGKGRITNVTPTAISYPAQSLSFVGDVDGFGFTGSPVTLTLDTVNTDVYGSNNFLKFAVNGKGLITSATPVSDGDITTALGYVPVNDAIELSINGVAHDLTANRSWNVGTVTGVSIIAGTGLNASISNPNTTPSISIINTAPDQTVVLTGGFGISVTGSYPNFTVTNDYPSLGGTVTNFSAGNLSPLFTTSVANSSTTPALSFALANAAANTVLAGPNGGTGAPSYRALVAADIPSLSYISNISVSAPLATTGGLTPTISISQANSTTNGYLSSTDWNTFNNKTSCTGTVTSVDLCSTTTGVSISGGPITTSGSINIDVATASAACTGLLTSTDWNTFNNKQDALGFTPVPDTRQLDINGVTYDLTADRCWSVGTVTSITASAPLTGGTITGSGSVGITQAGAGSDGYLSSADWNTFDSKQAAGNYITDLTGDGTASGPGSACLTLATVNSTTGTFGSSTQVPVITVNNKGLVTCVTTDTISGSLEFIGDVTGVGSTGTCTTLTLATVNNDVYASETLLNIAVNGKGLITSANPTTAGDICSTLGYTPENVANKSTSTSLGTSNTLYPTQLAVKTYVDNATSGGIILQGDWNAATNTPNISGTTTTGWAWRVSVAGTTNLGGITDWQIGDLAVKSATGWVKIDNSDGVTSVFGRFGAVVATTGDYLSCQVTECGNLYYTDARVRAAVGHTAPLTYCSTTGVFGITQSNTTTDGYLSATDWNTFNDKQPLIVAGTTSQYYRGDKTFQTLDTSVVTEGTNLYFTDGRARAALCAGAGISYNSTSGEITNSCPDQIVSLTGGGTTSITGTYPNFTITSSDCFSGTVTCVAVSGTNIGVTGSPITSAGTIDLSLSGANVCSALGYTPYNATNPAGYTTCVGTVTNVASCTSTTGVLLSGSPISTSGTLGIDISTASATCTGLLTSADWNTFNSKTSCLGTVTNVATCTSTTGVLLSGSPVTSSGTLGINISTASSVCTGLLTAADWNTFNSHTSCSGTVTSVGLSTSTTGVTIGSSPVTTSGTITLNIATASSTCTGLLTSADWNTFNSHTGCTGTVTCVNATGTNISVTGGPITTSGTLAISLSGANVCSALGYTPYDASNPNGYTTCTGTVTSVGIVATNINVCNSPVTTSGNICLNLTGANVCAALGYSPAPTSSVIMVLGSGSNSTMRCGVANTASGQFSAALSGTSNNTSGYGSLIAGGYGNTSSGSYASTIAGGEGNVANVNHATIVGGLNNTASASMTFIGAGKSNTASGACSVVVGGCANTNSASWSFLGGGRSNTLSGYSSTLSGGYNNKVCSNYSTISGGYNNTTCGAFSAIIGGHSNVTLASYTTVGGGKLNTSSGGYSTVAGGQQNTANGCRSAIGGGYLNTASSYQSTVAGGFSNTASSLCSTVAGGNANIASGSGSFIGGGQSNTASGNKALIGGGQINNATGNFSFIGNGYANVACAAYATIGGGALNTSSGRYTTLSGGYCNAIYHSVNDLCNLGATVSGGVGNNTTGGTWATAGFTVAPTKVNAGCFSFIGGGFQNRATGPWTVIGGGYRNVADGDTSAALSGQQNTSSCNQSVVAGGYLNNATAIRATVGGGQQNNATADYATIAGGYCNIACVKQTFIGGGSRNTASNNYSSVIGGYCNTASGNYSVAGGYNNASSGYMSSAAGGCQNIASSNVAFVGGGQANTASGNCSFVGGGQGNIASTSWSTVSGGISNTANGSIATIAGGNSNVASNAASVVSGGQSNTASGACSNISGGSCNLANSPWSSIGGGYANTASNSWSKVSGGLANTASGYLSFIGGGDCHVASGVRGTVGGGYVNTASGNCSTVSGGRSNTASGTDSVIGGGYGNTVSTGTSVVGGGYINRACGGSSTVSGGYNNASSGTYSTIAGGDSNNASGCTSFIGGGKSNNASGCYAIIGGGCGNTASGGYASFIGGGCGNIASGTRTTVVAGMSNTANNYSSFVGGGESNTSSGGFATISGGQFNTASSCYTVVAGGLSNTASGVRSTVSGGQGNNASGLLSFVGGGCANSALTLGSVVVGGYGNTSTGPYKAAVVGGNGNTVSGYYSFIGAGYNNCICGVYASTISGGYQNKISSGCRGTIGGGQGNIVYGPWGTIGGGQNNTSSCYRSTVSGGLSNSAQASYSSVGGGQDTSATGANSTAAGGRLNTASGGYSAISGGRSNTSSGYASISAGGRSNCATTTYSTVSGGYFNRVTTADYGTVSGGYNNSVSGSFSIIGGGRNNTATGACSVIAGGCTNTASGNNSAIGGGIGNTSSGGCSTIGGGQSNQATNNWSTISGGSSNSAIAVHSVVGGGCGNTASGLSSNVAGGSSNVSCGSYAFVGGGQCNRSCGACSAISGGNINNICVNACGSFIGAGQCNTAIGTCSAILSGRNNNACGNGSFAGGAFTTASGAYSAVFGCGLTNSCACSFMSNILRASTLSMNGIVYSNTCTLTNTNPSDRTLKCNITASAYGLCELKQLTPVRYKWINGDGSCNLGFIAQEVKEVLPSFVGENDDKTLGLYSDRFTPLTIKAVQELNDKLDAQEQRIAILEDIIKRNNLI